MALINCPECQKDISSESKNCPNCGYVTKRLNKKGQKKKKLVCVLIISVVILAAAGIFGYFYVESYNAAVTVMNTIENLNPIGLDSKESILKAEESYYQLSDFEKGLVKNKDAIGSAMEEFINLKTEPVISLISSIGDVTLESENLINQATAKYNELPEDEKIFVTNYNVLEEAAITLNSLPLELNAKNIRDCINVDISFSDLISSSSTLWGLTEHKGSAVMHINCYSLKEMTFEDAVIEISFIDDTTPFSNLNNWKLPPITLRLSSSGDGKSSITVEYFSMLSAAKMPSVAGKYKISRASGRIYKK